MIVLLELVFEQNIHTLSDYMIRIYLRTVVYVELDMVNTNQILVVT